MMFELVYNGNVYNDSSHGFDINRLMENRVDVSNVTAHLKTKNITRR